MCNHMTQSLRLFWIVGWMVLAMQLWEIRFGQQQKTQIGVFILFNDFSVTFVTFIIWNCWTELAGLPNILVLV